MTPRTAAHQASLSITNSRSSLKLTCIKSVMPPSNLILCHPLFLLPPIPPSIRVFSKGSTLPMRSAHYQRNANQNHNEVPFHASQNGCYQNSTISKCWRGCGEKGTLLHCWWECNLVQPLWRTVWRFLKKLEIELPYDPAIPLLGIHIEETRIERDTCTTMFIKALFIIASTWKQPRCPPADE